jgi:outer membrane protein TolC
MDHKIYNVRELEAKQAAAASLAELVEAVARLDAKVDSLLDLAGTWSTAEDAPAPAPAPESEPAFASPPPPTRGRGRT